MATLQPTRCKAAMVRRMLVRSATSWRSVSSSTICDSLIPEPSNMVATSWRISASSKCRGATLKAMRVGKATARLAQAAIAQSGTGPDPAAALRSLAWSACFKAVSP